MKKKVSLKDIALKVGVSTALVSYVLNNKKEGRIRKEVAERIREEAHKLNYRVNYAAKALKTNRSFTIGLIVADISNPYSSSLARIIEDEAEKNNYTVIFGSSDENAEKSFRLMNVLLDRQVDGFIIAAAERGKEQIKYLEERDVPFVLVDRYFPELKTNYVAIDNFKAAYSAIEHLIQNQYKRIGIIAYETDLFHLNERERGYAAALKDHNIAGRKSWIKHVTVKETKDEIEKAIQELLALSQPIDSLFFVSNTIATCAIKYINSLQLKVPEDLGIVTFDQSDASDLFYAPLTYVRQPLEEIGKEATRILLDCVSRNNKTTQINLEAELVVRKSTIRGRK